MPVANGAQIHFTHLKDALATPDQAAQNQTPFSLNICYLAAVKRRTIKICIAVFVVMALVIGLIESIPPSQDAREAADKLKMATKVNFGGGGYFGMISEAEDNLFKILSSHRGEDLLSEVFEAGSPEAKTYALCGLHYIAPRRFERYADQFAAEKVKIQTLSGCIGGEHDSATIVAAIRTNIFEHYLPLRKEAENHRRKIQKEADYSR